MEAVVVMEVEMAEGLQAHLGHEETSALLVTCLAVEQLMLEVAQVVAAAECEKPLCDLLW